MIGKFLRLALIASIMAIGAAPVFADDTAPPVYTYNDQGQVVLATYPNGAAVAYTYDSSGNISSIVQVASGSSDAPAGQ